MHWGQRMMSTMAAVAVLGAVNGCSDDETGPAGHNSPVAAMLVVDGITEVQEGETLLLAAGATAHIEVRLLDEHGDVIDGIEEHHFLKLLFSPTTLATSADVADHHFQKNVTAQAGAGTGTLDIGYGHSEAADEDTFGTFDVTVAVP